MEFAAKKVWVPRRQEDLQEEIDEEELAGGVAVAASNASAPPRQTNGRVRRVEGASTNVLNVELGTLGNAVQVATGEVFLCACGAAFSSVSVERSLTQNKEGFDPMWTCEFCKTSSRVPLAAEEYPKSDTVDYLLEAPRQQAAQNAQNNNNNDDDNDDNSACIVFCVDVSGSMCVTVPVEGVGELKGRREVAADVLQFRERGALQMVPGEKAGQRYVSRLQCVQAAVEAQVERLATEGGGTTKVGLVTFGSDVKVEGGGGTLAGDILRNAEELEQKGRQEGERVGRVAQQKDQLKQTLYGLEEGGTTALGPALCVALGMAAAASKGRAGARVIICTDGLANTGCGSLEDDPEKGTQFYRDMGKRAKERGVSVSVVAIEGTQCRMEALGALAEESGGDLDIVRPTELARNFSNILAERVLATEVTVELLVHHNMAVLDPARDEATLCRMRKDVGAITPSSAVAFEFRIRTDMDASKNVETHLPFQVQIKFRRPDGSLVLRTQTRLQEVTQDRQEAERDANVDVLASNAIQQAAGYAQSGNYEKARSKMVAQQKLMTRASPAGFTSPAYAGYVSVAEKLDEELKSEAKNSNDDEVDEQTRMSRVTSRSDKASAVIYKAKKFSSKK